MKKHLKTGKLNLNAIEVFRTNISSFYQSELVKIEILKKYPETLLSFDLEDRENILRVEGKFDNQKVIQLAKGIGVIIEPLED